jgi:4-hydroxybenzoate polyprenyltransferase
MHVISRLKEYAQLVAFEHTVFALPFALSAMVLAAAPAWPPVNVWGWVIVAMVGGRTYAMALNRLLDATIDAANPRTKNRAIPAGRVKKAEAWLLVGLSGALLTGATFQLPVLCQQLLPVAFLILTLYSFMKRFSNLAHLVLGLALGSSAIAGWIAVTGEWSNQAMLLGVSVLLWVTGFDLIYACQDVDFDREYGLHSLPVTLGVAGALRLSRACHSLTVLGLAAFGAWYPYTGWPFWLAVLCMGGFLVYEHRLVSPENLSKIDQAFFTVNGYISITIFACVLLDRWM